MSFSSEVKDELVRVFPASGVLLRAELEGMLFIGGKYSARREAEPTLALSSEHAGTVRKYFTLLKKTDKIKGDLSVTQKLIRGKNRLYTLSLEAKSLPHIAFSADAGFGNGAGEREAQDAEGIEEMETEVARAFLRGAFLAGGSVSDPEKSYHLEIVCQEIQKALALKTLLNHLGLEPGVAKRKQLCIVYLKSSEEIVEMLGMMEAGSALMELENIRIVKDMRNSVNRKVNCEAANISKTIGAAVKQLEDIEWIRDTKGLDSLPEGLAEVATLRLRYPDASLRELGERISPPVGKSGVNHRLRKLSEYAEGLRGREKQ